MVLAMHAPAFERKEIVGLGVASAIVLGSDLRENAPYFFAGLAGMLVGNQIGVLVDELVRASRLIGVAVLAWDIHGMLEAGRAGTRNNGDALDAALGAIALGMMIVLPRWAVLRSAPNRAS